MKKVVKTLLASALVLGAGALTSCGGNKEEEVDLGFEEVEIFSDKKVDFLLVNAVYFQAVDMTGGYKASDYSCHLELDISADKNDYGYEVGSWVPYLSISFSITKDGAPVDSGTFMPMAASDGPHYGNNVHMGEDGTYNVEFTIKYPEGDEYLIHTDNTGPKSSTFPSTATFSTEWNYKFGSWAE